MGAQLTIIEDQEFPILKFEGYCTDEVFTDIKPKIENIADKGLKKFVFDFSDCKLMNSLAMGELLDLVLLIDRNFEGYVVISGLDRLKTTLFTVSGIIPLAQTANNLSEAFTILKPL